MTIYGARVFDDEYGLLTPSEDSSPAEVVTEMSEHCRKTIAATTNKREYPSPGRTAWKQKMERSVVCTAAETRTPRHRESPQQKQQTFSSRKDNFASNPRRREKLLTAGEGGKLDHQHQSSTRASSARFQPLTFGTAVGAGVLRRHARSRQLYILSLAITGSLA